MGIVFEKSRSKYKATTIQRNNHRMQKQFKDKTLQNNNDTWNKRAIFVL